jgi:hypothetical protein
MPGFFNRSIAQTFDSRPMDGLTPPIYWPKSEKKLPSAEIMAVTKM